MIAYTKRHGAFPDNVERETPSITLPLSRFSSVSGDAGDGPSSPGFLATDSGVVVNRRGRISLYASNLLRELWGVPLKGWSGEALAACDALYFGVAENQVREFSLQDGSVRRSFSYESGSLAALDRDTAILLRSRYIEAADWSGAKLWSAEIAPGGLMAHADGNLYLSAIDPFRRGVLCIAASTGETKWKCEPPAEGTGDAAMMSNTVSTVAVVGEHVLVIPRDGRRLFVLEAKTGNVESISRLPTLPGRGEFFVTAREVISFHPYVVSFFDHREMRETRRIDLRDDVEPMYDGRAPRAYGVCLIRGGAIWTAPHGAFMGITFEPGPDGRRVTWVGELPGALIPKGIPPVVHNGYMYYTNMGEPLELLCYASNSSGE